MNQQNQNSEQYPEDVIEILKRLINQNKEEEQKNVEEANYDNLDDQNGLNLKFQDQEFISNLNEYAEQFEDQKQQDAQIDIEKDQEVEKEEQTTSVNQQPQKELTYEEKLKWIDDVFNAAYFKDEESSQDRIQDEQSQDSDEEDNIYQMEKKFFERIKQQERDEEEKRIAQVEKDRKLYEEIVGEKHRKVQIIVLSSTSSSQSSSPKIKPNQNMTNRDIKQQYFIERQISEGEQNDNKSGQQKADDDFLVKEEYISDEESQQLQNDKIDTQMDQENKEIENKEQEYQNEMKNLYQQDINYYNQNEQANDFQKEENLGIYSQLQYNNNDYEKELEDLFDKLNIK